MNNTQQIKLSAPSYSGYKEIFESLEAAREQAAYILDCTVAEMVEVKGSDETYCYATQEAADADQDGAYSVKYERHGDL